MATEQSGPEQVEPPDRHQSVDSLNSGSDYGLSRLFDSGAGYDLEFVKRDQKYDCPICLLVLREPMQTECGHRFCKACILKWLRESESRCPVDNIRLEESQLFTDNFAKREILALKVKCPNHAKGCDQFLVLKHLQDHLEHCDYSFTPCPFLCANVLLRRDLDSHTRLKCPKRPVSCPVCKQGLRADELQSHVEICPLVTVRCSSCDVELSRQQLQPHINGECPKVKVKCQYYFLGCQYEGERSCMATHDVEFIQFHMSLQNKAILKLFEYLRIGPQSQQVPSIHRPSSLGYQPTEISVSSAGAMGSGSGSTSFPSYFPSLPQQASAVGTMQQLFQQMSVSSPTTGQIIAQENLPALDVESLVGQSAGHTKNGREGSGETAVSDAMGAGPRTPSSGTRIASEISYTSNPSNRNDNDMAPTQSFLDTRQFQSFKSQNDFQDESLARHDQQLLDLAHKNEFHEKMYKDLKARIKLLENTISEFEGRCGNGVFTWKIKNYQKLRREAEKGETTAIHSAPFYSSYYGYKMCIRVNLNGVDSARGTHLSVFIHFMQGDFDDQLEWPFNGRIILTVMDQNPTCELRRPVAETLLSKPNLAAFQRPVHPRNHKGFGYMEFLPLSQVDGSTYIRNDTLIIKAQIISAAI